MNEDTYAGSWVDLPEGVHVTWRQTEESDSGPSLVQFARAPLALSSSAHRSRASCTVNC